MSDFLRMSGLYWSLTFLDLCNSTDRFNRQDIVDFVKRNQRECGGFAPSDGHDPHLLYSLSALQVIAHITRLNKQVQFICVEKIDCDFV